MKKNEKDEVLKFLKSCDLNIDDFLVKENIDSKTNPYKIITFHKGEDEEKVEFNLLDESNGIKNYFP